MSTRRGGIAVNGQVIPLHDSRDASEARRKPRIWASASDDEPVLQWQVSPEP